MKRLIDLDEFVNILPYSSEIFGIYQPLMGWKGERDRPGCERICICGRGHQLPGPADCAQGNSDADPEIMCGCADVKKKRKSDQITLDKKTLRNRMVFYLFLFVFAR